MLREPGIAQEIATEMARMVKSLEPRRTIVKRVDKRALPTPVTAFTVRLGRHKKQYIHG